jgi:hypothetical protein
VKDQQRHLAIANVEVISPSGKGKDILVVEGIDIPLCQRYWTRL